MAEDKNKKPSVWSKYTEEDKAALNKLCDGYIDFLSRCKTERESVREAIACAEKSGYKNLDDVIRSGEKLNPGDKVYYQFMKKSVVLFQIGTEPIERGLKILGAHIDTCRLDIKQNPLYEDGGLAYLDTHYYGGIKKYQWVTLPLAMHGVVVKKDGTVLEIVIGEDEKDPVFCVTDLLVHLSQEQMKKAAAKVIDGENLDILVGNYPLKEGDKESVKAGILKILEEKYKIETEDFLSAELALVPAGKARSDLTKVWFSVTGKTTEFAPTLRWLPCWKSRIKVSEKPLAVCSSIKRKSAVSAQPEWNRNFLRMRLPK